MGIAMPSGNMFAAGFGHLMGYDAGYYGYLWSKVYADDMAMRFKQEGFLNPTTGSEYRSWILEKGSSMDELELVKGFLGREPNDLAFLEDIGIQ
jgi:thimet oligopeptidase